MDSNSQQKMHIIQIITELYPAGAERVVANLSVELKKQGHNVAVISLQPLPESSVIVDELLENNISVKTLNLTKFTPWRIFKLRKLLKTGFRQETLDKRLRTKKRKPENADNQQQSTNNNQLIVHSHLIHANLVCRINNIFGKKYKLINTIHIAEKRKRKRWHFRLDKLTLKFCNCQTAVSKAAAEHHAKMLKIPTEQIRVVYNGIESPKHLTFEEIHSLKKQWNVDNCNKIIGSVGRLNWQKGYDIFLRLVPELAKKIPKNETWGIVIIGEGIERKKLEDLVKKIPDNIKVILPGYRSDAADCIGAFDLFIMPSRYEGFGLTLVEAIAHGVPCLSSSADSLPGIISHYGNGKIIDFSHSNCLYKIIQYINQPCIKAVNKYSINKMINGYLKLYKD